MVRRLHDETRFDYTMTEMWLKGLGLNNDTIEGWVNPPYDGVGSMPEALHYVAHSFAFDALDRAEALRRLLLWAGTP
jgi:hypothetical protein